MIMADVLKIFLLIVGAMLTTVSYWLLFQALFPQGVRCAQHALAARPLRTTLAGLLIGGPLLALSLILLNAGGPPGQLLGGGLAVTLVLTSLFGATGLARQTGEGLPMPVDATQPWRPVARGGLILVVCCVLPVAGWFFLLPVILVSGFGGGIIALWRGRSRKPATPTLQETGA